ncbi:MAG TPA: hypothetical protein VIL86_18750 [Tepidisphaeraceae bacterium]|jgi:hypothetical protein
MKAKDWFLVGVRLFGVWMLLEGVAQTVVLLQAMLGLVTLQRTWPIAYIMHALVDFAIGVYLLQGAPLLIALAKWERKPEHPECAYCGYDLTGNVSGTCPECGKPVPEDTKVAS